MPFTSWVYVPSTLASSQRSSLKPQMDRLMRLEAKLERERARREGLEIYVQELEAARASRKA